MPKEALERSWFNVGVEVGEISAEFAVYGAGKEMAVAGLLKYCADNPWLKLAPRSDAEAIEPYAEPMSEEAHAGMQTVQPFMPELPDGEAVAVNLLTYAEPQPPSAPIGRLYGPPYVPKTPVPVIRALSKAADNC